MCMCHVCGREGVRLTGYDGKDILHGGIDTPYSMYNEKVNSDTGFHKSVIWALGTEAAKNSNTEVR